MTDKLQSNLRDGDQRSVTVALLDIAAARLYEASEMLQLEASEWLSRKSQPPKYWRAEEGSWADKCGRIAETNTAASRAMARTSKLIMGAAVGRTMTAQTEPTSAAGA